MTINLAEIAQFIGYIGAIAGATISAYTVVKRYLTKHIFEKLAETDKKISDLSKTVSSLEKWTNRQQLDIEKGVQKDRIFMKALLEALKAIRDQRANGGVSEAIKMIEDFMADNANIALSHRE